MIPTPDHEITFHPFADGGVLHRTGSHRLWVLNITAATLWCLMDGRSGAQDLARSYAARFGIDAGTAGRDVGALLERFRQWGLLNGESPRDLPAPGAETRLTPIGVEKQLKNNLHGLPRMTFSLAGHCFAVAFSDQDLFNTWRHLFGHLATGEEPSGKVFGLAVLREEKDGDYRFCCYADGVCRDGGLPPDEIVPFLVYTLFEACMAGLQHRLLFHAAVVARDDRALLLPAPSGSGKSTLAAALAASGWTYLSDELAVLDPATLCVAPFALPIGLKDKSMDALAGRIPGVADLPRHIRADGVGVRYHKPPKVHTQEPLPVGALVFPRYSVDASSGLQELKPLESLEGLAATGSSSRPLANGDIQAMLKLAQLPSHALDFSDLNTAVECLNGLDCM